MLESEPLPWQFLRSAELRRLALCWLSWLQSDRLLRSVLLPAAGCANQVRRHGRPVVDAVGDLAPPNNCGPARPLGHPRARLALPRARRRRVVQADARDHGDRRLRRRRAARLAHPEPAEHHRADDLRRRRRPLHDSGHLPVPRAAARARAKAAAAAWATTERAAARPAFSGRGTPSAALLAAKQKLHAFNELRGAFVLQHGLVQHFRFAEYLRLSLGRRLERLVGVHRTGAALALPLVALLRAVHADACGAAEAGGWSARRSLSAAAASRSRRRRAARSPSACARARASSRRSGTGSRRATSTRRAGWPPPSRRSRAAPTAAAARGGRPTGGAPSSGSPTATRTRRR